MMSRIIAELVPELRIKYRDFEERMGREGIDFIVTCTYRPQKEQNKLYAQGRSMPGIIVTWTKNSKHTKREAFDIAVVKNGKISWSNKDYEVPGRIGEAVGLVWGGRFKRGNGQPRPDRLHFELFTGVLDAVAEIAGSGVAGKKAQATAVTYNVIKETGLLKKIGGFFIRLFNFRRKNG